MIEFDNKAVGKAIRKLRNSKRQSQEVFSSFCGIARSHLSMIEEEAEQDNG